MEEIVKISIISIFGVLIAVQFKSVKPEFSTYLSVALAIILFAMVVQQLRTMLSGLAWMKELLGGTSGYLGILIKVIGITYLCEFSAGICKDAGYGTVAEQIEVLGKLSVMFAGLPILLAVIEQIKGFMG